ncbi:MAG: hypothetical protein ACXABG_09720 [Promethearchaeota archaeon]|jgi:hypothetical protein
MLFQLDPTLEFVLWLILATVLVALILYIAVLLIASKTKASDKKFVIILLALIFVLILPIILGAINSVLSVIGSLVAFSGSNYLPNLTPIIGFLIILVLSKFLLSIPWDQAVWISLLTLFFLYLLYTMIPQLASFLGFGL